MYVLIISTILVPAGVLGRCSLGEEGSYPCLRELGCFIRTINRGV